ncbi:putative C6 transcription factor [Stipitochalara longipes BDJ]|nr:putative C6 transcription factor [Stipitochalara longipes BDJ]
MTEPELHRRRPPVSCSLCRRRKIKCNRGTPCSNCVRSKNRTCNYENNPPQPPQQNVGQDPTPAFGLLQKTRKTIPTSQYSSTSTELTLASYPQSSLGASLTKASSLASQPSAWDVELMRNKIRQLEEQLAIATPMSTQSPISAPNSTIETITSRFGGTFHIHHESRSLIQPETITRSVTHKNRQFGRSHWINIISLFPDISEMTEPNLQDETSQVFSGIQRCKSLARVIKSMRAPPWPTPLTTDIPSKDIADELIECYLQTTESVYRILHIPTFRRDYKALWEVQSGTEPNTTFLVQLKLVLAIGATTYDEQFSLRVSAVRWVYEAQTWLSEPKSKSRLGIEFLQTNILLLLATEMVAIGGDSIWISAGALLRRGMSMGLHRDPVDRTRTVFTIEMHRRLWNTILEITLQSSLTFGGPPLLSLNDFDTAPPSNLDDEQLMTKDPIPVPEPEDHFTQMSIAIALRKTFPLRLAIAKFLNDIGSNGTYEEALRLDTDFRAACKCLYRTIQACTSSTGPSFSRFATCVVDFLIHHYFSSLHIPFFDLAVHETAYAFSRKVVIETSLKIWYAAYSFPSHIAAQIYHDTTSSNRDDFARLITCGSGFYRTVTMRAALLIVAELRTQLQEEESLGSELLLRPDLLAVLEDSKTWCLRCIEAGETNIKGYLLICVLATQIDGLRRRLGKGELTMLLIKAAEDAEEKCLPILEEMVARLTGDGLLQTLLNTPPGVVEDWDFLVSTQ